MRRPRAVAMGRAERCRAARAVSVRLPTLVGLRGLSACPTVGSGLQVLNTMLAEDVTTPCRPRINGTLARPLTRPWPASSVAGGPMTRVSWPESARYR
jgi:hypothetical protein